MHHKINSGREIIKPSVPESKVLVVEKFRDHFFDPTFHTHPEYQLMLVTEGEGTRFIGNSVSLFCEGDLVLTGPNLPHAWRNKASYVNDAGSKPVAGIVVYFHDHFLGKPMEEKEEFENIRFVLQKSLRGIEIGGSTNLEVRYIMEDMVGVSGPRKIIRLLEILDLLAQSKECRALNHTPVSHESTPAEHDRLNEVYTFVRKYYDTKIMIEHVARLSHMTPSSFSRFFKMRMNKTFTDFVKEVRIEAACKLLRKETIPIRSIAYECGFETLSNFNRQFKMMLGMPPLLYRKEFFRSCVESLGYC
jgi:AraC-like DNA-binding protein